MEGTFFSQAQGQQRLPVVISVVSSAELWHPCTMLLVQCERSLLVSALKRCVSIPCLVPVRVAKDRSIPAWGDPFPGPEWTSLLRQRKITTMETRYSPETLRDESLSLSIGFHFSDLEPKGPLYLNVHHGLLPSPHPVPLQGYSETNTVAKSCASS